MQIDRFVVQEAARATERAVEFLGQPAASPEEAADRALSALALAAAIEAAIKPMKEAARLLLEEVVAEVGTVQTAMGSARTVAGYTRHGWDSKGLDKLVKLSPSAAELLAPYRTETDVKATVKIELAKEAAK